jgi:GNAT superfamily N-acetyltransferase
MTIELAVHPVTAERLNDLAALFSSSKTTNGCYCTWNILPAKQCQTGWSGGNRLSFEELTKGEAEPVGLLAYQGDEPVGWIAVGPRARYERMLRTPTLAGHDPTEDRAVWFVTCFYVRRDARRSGVTRALLKAAVALARSHKAIAIEGYPLAGDARRSAAEAFVGVEPLFASCGFTAARRPSAARVIMRRDLGRKR